MTFPVSRFVPRFFGDKTKEEPKPQHRPALAPIECPIHRPALARIKCPIQGCDWERLVSIKIWVQSGIFDYQNHYRLTHEPRPVISWEVNPDA